MGIKSLVASFLPQSVRELAWYLTDEGYRKRCQLNKTLRMKQKSAAIQIAKQTNGLVVSGPFAGTQYPTDGRFPQKLLGTYELELHKLFSQLAVTKSYEAVVDIGAAEGFYVCGCARLFKNAKIIGFESNSKLHPVIKHLASLNLVSDRVELYSECTVANLGEILKKCKQSLVICDVEGAEDQLLVPSRFPTLLEVDILVEVHDHLCPNVSQRLRERFSLTHSIETILSRPREQADFPPQIDLDMELRLPAMEESRHAGSHWFWITPH
jgi:hypothetical protein